MFLWVIFFYCFSGASLPSCGGPGQLPSLPSLKSGPGVVTGDCSQLRYFRDQFTESVAYQLTTEQCCRLNKLTRGPLHPWLDPAYRLERHHLQHINLDELQHNKLLQYSKSTTIRGNGDSRLSVNQSCIFRVVHVIKSLQDPLERGNNLPGSTFATTYRKIYSI